MNRAKSRFFRVLIIPIHAIALLLSENDNYQNMIHLKIKIDRKCPLGYERVYALVANALKKR